MLKFLKLRFHLCSRIWLKPNRSFINNFPLSSHWSFNTVMLLSVCLLNVHNVLQNLLREVEARMSVSDLFNLLMLKEIKSFLNYSDLPKNVLTFLSDCNCLWELIINTGGYRIHTTTTAATTTTRTTTIIQYYRLKWCPTSSILTIDLLFSLFRSFVFENPNCIFFNLKSNLDYYIKILTNFCNER